MISAELSATDLIITISRFDRHLSTVLPQALAKSADEVAAEARTTTEFNDDSGTLRESIQADEVRGSWDGGNLRATVAAGQPYGIYLEEGTSAHRVEPRHRRSLRWATEGGFFFSKGHVVGGIRPRKFLADALSQNEAAISRNFEQAVDLAAAMSGF